MPEIDSAKIERVIKKPPKKAVFLLVDIER
jgi:hypothetical protein